MSTKNDDEALFFVAIIVGSLIGAAIATWYWAASKWECEEKLPRNVECVWVAPQEVKP